MADVSGLPFHRKYRPNTLKSYIGNVKLKETILKVLATDNRPQVMLFMGSSGCGKTSLARLVAKEYSCPNRDNETGACGVCPSCEIIDEYIATGEGSILTSIREVNIAEKNGVHDLDDIFEEMELPAFGDEWKIFIFDECHKASNALQNRFLKIVEEPPEHILILFCTTNPDEMLDTLRNRCQLQLRVSKPTVKELAGLLASVCSTEQVDYDKAGLEFIANHGELTIRTALQNLWQVVNEQGSAKYDNVVRVFDEISNTLMLSLFTALKAKDTLRYITLLCDAKSKVDLDSFFRELKNFVVRGIYTINGITQEGVSAGELISYRVLFGDLGVVQIGQFLNRLLHINMNNLELELIMLGYGGFDVEESKPTALTVQPLEDELSKESVMTGKILKEHQEISYSDGVKNAEKSMGSVDVDLLLSMGATIVEN